MTAALDELKAIPQWVGWRFVTVDGKPTKVPYVASNGRRANTAKPSTWQPFEAASASYKKAGHRGLGFVVTDHDPYCGIDIDKCRDLESGEIEPWAREIIDRIDSYTEITPSGTGVRVWLKARKQPGDKCSCALHGGKIEIYDRVRFFAVTGQHLSGTPDAMEDRQTALNALYGELWPSQPVRPERPAAGVTGALSADEILELARQAKNAPKWERLMRGDTSVCDGDDSRADASLCFLVAFYNRDPTVIDQIVRRSGLMRDKWDRADYRERTILKALDQVTETYEPPGEIRGAGRGVEAARVDPRAPGERAKVSPMSDWEPIDLGPYLRGEIVEPAPSMLDRADGQCLLYAGKLHWISGEPESGKSWLVQIAAADCLMDGGAVLYLDFEGDPAAMVGRLRALGVSDEAISQRLSYHRPSTPMSAEAVEQLLTVAEQLQPALSVIDGVQAAMGSSGFDSNKALDFYRWWAAFGPRLRQATKGPTAAVDHVVKDPNARAQYAAGTGQKLAAVDVHIGVEPIDSFGLGMTGRSRLVLHKDKAGHLRPHLSGQGVIATLVLKSDPETRQVQFLLEPPPGAGAERRPFRPTQLMERVSQYLENRPEAASKRQIRSGVTGMEKHVLSAVDRLLEEGFLAVAVKGSYDIFSSLKPYRRTTDPLDSEPSGASGARWCFRGAGHRVKWGGAMVLSLSGEAPTSTTTTGPTRGASGANGESPSQHGKSTPDVTRLVQAPKATCPHCGWVTAQAYPDGVRHCPKCYRQWKPDDARPSMPELGWYSAAELAPKGQQR